jgi:hypothetical protein
MRILATPTPSAASAGARDPACQPQELPRDPPGDSRDPDPACATAQRHPSVGSVFMRLLEPLPKLFSARMRAATRRDPQLLVASGIRSA